jgi:hypothetical protein
MLTLQTVEQITAFLRDNKYIFGTNTKCVLKNEYLSIADTEAKYYIIEQIFTIQE